VLRRYEPVKRPLFSLYGGQARIVGERLQRLCDSIGELLKTLNELGAAGAAQAVQQPAGALETWMSCSMASAGGAIEAYGSISTVAPCARTRSRSTRRTGTRRPMRTAGSLSWSIP